MKEIGGMEETITEELKNELTAQQGYGDFVSETNIATRSSPARRR